MDEAKMGLEGEVFRLRKKREETNALKEAMLQALNSKQSTAEKALAASPPADILKALANPTVQDALKGIENAGKKAEDLWQIKPDGTPGRPMGMTDHPFAKPTAVIPRTFRFTLRPKTYPHLECMVKNVTIDYYLKEMTVEMYETCTDDTYNYIMHLLDKEEQEMRLTTYDGCGRTISTMEFKGVTLLGHNVEYNYAKSDVVTHRMKFDFLEMERVKNYH